LLIAMKTTFHNIGMCFLFHRWAYQQLAGMAFF